MDGSMYVIVTRYRDNKKVYGPYPSDQAARAELRRMRKRDQEEYGDEDTPEMSAHKVLSEPEKP